MNTLEEDNTPPFAQTTKEPTKGDDTIHLSKNDAAWFAAVVCTSKQPNEKLKQALTDSKENKLGVAIVESAPGLN